MNPLQARIQAWLENNPARPFWPLPEGTPDFVSNDYLGLVHEGVISEILGEAPREFWRGATASRYLGGDHLAFHAVEAAAQALWAQPHEAALFFPSGLTANLAFWASVPQRGDTVLFDREVHASIRQGIRLSGATAWGFPHNRWEEAEKRLRQATGKVFLVVESLYSMRGTMPDLAALQALCARYNPYLVVDEAHTTGILPGGASWAAPLQPLARLFTFGKAIGLMGAVWIAPTWLIAYLQRRGFAGIYTTAMPPLIAWAVAQVLNRSAQWEPQRERLWAIVALARRLLGQAHVPYEGLEGPIALLSLSHPNLPLKRLYPPTVPQPAYRLSLHAHNTPAQLQALIAALQQA
ncbi:MAG: aminotransferase class I/II-fold pyridoxal phosphate-dependent enzyme [Bacteroidetes bacterium]|nr:MAG: aminotransferase class I/II-fold pyridoxal phosphate-dependent enzyme [Bacteroidota bacterium]